MNKRQSAEAVIAQLSLERPQLVAIAELGNVVTVGVREADGSISATVKMGKSAWDGIVRLQSVRFAERPRS